MDSDLHFPKLYSRSVSCLCEHCRGLTGAASLMLLTSLSDCAATGGWDQVYMVQNMGLDVGCLDDDLPCH